jgi:hypothetical protein
VKKENDNNKATEFSPELIDRICKKILHMVEIIPELGATNPSLSAVSWHSKNLQLYKDKISQFRRNPGKVLEAFLADSDTSSTIPKHELQAAKIINTQHYSALSKEQLLFYAFVKNHIFVTFKPHILRVSQLTDYLADANPPLVPFGSTEHVSYPPSKTAAMMLLAYGVEGMKTFLDITKSVPEEEYKRFVPRVFENPALRKTLEAEGIQFPEDPIYVGPRDRSEYKNLRSEFRNYRI